MITNVHKNFKNEKFNTKQLQQWLDATKTDETCVHQRKKVEKYIANLKKIDNVVEEFCDKINDQKNKLDDFFTERCYSKEEDDFVELCEIDCGFWIVSTIPPRLQQQQKHEAKVVVENEAKVAENETETKAKVAENETETKAKVAENETETKAKVSETTTTIVPITPLPRRRWNPKRHLGTDAVDKNDVDDGSKPKKYIIQYSTCDSRAHAQNALATLNAGYIQIPLKIITICLDKLPVFDELFISSNQHYCDARLQQLERTIVISTLGFEDVALVEQLKDWRNDVTNVNKFVKTDTVTIFDLDTKSCPANQLIDLVRPSLVGIGTETVYDPTIRKASEIGGTVYFIPPIGMWNGIFREVYEYFHRSINVQFDKVSVYTKGDFFDAHRDTVRAPNHIATLLIGTDYEYEGGKFTFGQSHKKTNDDDDDDDDEETRHSYKLDKKSFLLFYTDTLHSVERVTSGTRVVLQFKVFLADSAMPSDYVVITPSTNFATSFTYSPGNSAPFYSKNEFCDQITSKDHENFDNIQDAYYSSNKDNESIASADNKDYMDSFIVQSSPKSPSSIEIAPNILGEILLAHRFKCSSKHVLGLILNHFYPQKHIEPKFLRGNDKRVYDMLLKNEHVKNLVLTPIHLIRVWSYCDDSDIDSMNLRVPKEFYDAHKYLGRKQLPLFVHNKQKLEEIIKLSSSVYPNGNEGVSATGEYWYAAAMCLVEFVMPSESSSSSSSSQSL